MSRMLSELLGAREPDFRLNLQALERAAGAPSADVRLTSQVLQATAQKLRELGLDPADTTGPELYQALQERFRADEQRVREGLGQEEPGSPLEILERVKAFLEKTDAPKQAFVIKQSAMRGLIKKLAPKATMKRLGYRSLDSMLKHESVPQLYAAACMSESSTWQRQLIKQYEKLTASDFETRPVSFYLPTAKHWPELAARFVGEKRHNMLTIRELGAVVMLPIEEDLPGLAITSLLLGLESVNEIRSQSSFLKLHQVQPDFGKVLADATLHEPITQAKLAGQALPWRVIQRFYGQGTQEYHPEVFEPHVQPEDMSWHEAEAALAKIHPALEFWQGGQMLGLLDHGEPVSCNLFDVALSVCNDLPYASRFVHHMQQSLWHGLLARYLHQENLEALVLGSLNRELAPEPVFDESVALLD